VMCASGSFDGILDLAISPLHLSQYFWLFHF